MAEEKKNPSAATERNFSAIPQRLVDSTDEMCSHMMKACLRDLAYQHIPEDPLENMEVLSQLSRITAYLRLASFIRAIMSKEPTYGDLISLEMFVSAEIQQMDEIGLYVPVFLKGLLRSTQKILNNKLNNFES
ncbi:hypothetical protein [Faecalibaculum rodentium]|nr:hypothetical protein [Faecalibaculum rodentium]